MDNTSLNTTPAITSTVSEHLDFPILNSLNDEINTALQNGGNDTRVHMPYESHSLWTYNDRSLRSLPAEKLENWKQTGRTLRDALQKLQSSLSNSASSSCVSSPASVKRFSLQNSKDGMNEMLELYKNKEGNFVKDSDGNVSDPVSNCHPPTIKSSPTAAQVLQRIAKIKDKLNESDHPIQSDCNDQVCEKCTQTHGSCKHHHLPKKCTCKNVCKHDHKSSIKYLRHNCDALSESKDKVVEHESSSKMNDDASVWKGHSCLMYDSDSDMDMEAALKGLDSSYQDMCRTRQDMQPPVFNCVQRANDSVMNDRPSIDQLVPRFDTCNRIQHLLSSRGHTWGESQGSVPNINTNSIGISRSILVNESGRPSTQSEHHIESQSPQGQVRQDTKSYSGRGICQFEDPFGGTLSAEELQSAVAGMSYYSSAVHDENPQLVPELVNERPAIECVQRPNVLIRDEMDVQIMSGESSDSEHTANKQSPVQAIESMRTMLNSRLQRLVEVSSVNHSSWGQTPPSFVFNNTKDLKENDGHIPSSSSAAGQVLMVTGSSDDVYCTSELMSAVSSTRSMSADSTPANQVKQSWETSDAYGSDEYTSDDSMSLSFNESLELPSLTGVIINTSDVYMPESPCDPHISFTDSEMAQFQDVSLDLSNESDPDDPDTISTLRNDESSATTPSVLAWDALNETSKVTSPVSRQENNVHSGAIFDIDTAREAQATVRLTTDSTAEPVANGNGSPLEIVNVNAASARLLESDRSSTPMKLYDTEAISAVDMVSPGTSSDLSAVAVTGTTPSELELTLAPRVDMSIVGGPQLNTSTLANVDSWSLSDIAAGGQTVRPGSSFVCGSDSEDSVCDCPACVQFAAIDESARASASADGSGTSMVPWVRSSSGSAFDSRDSAYDLGRYLWSDTQSNTNSTLDPGAEALANPVGSEISIFDLNPFNLVYLSMYGIEANLLEQLFQGVVQQILDIYPDLQGDHGPPPLSQVDFDRIPITKITPDIVARDTQCPICLVEFVADDICKELSCHHIYHALCIQMWLNQAATCPVCRHNIALDFVDFQS